MAGPMAMIIDAPTAWTTRKAIRTVSLGEAPQQTLAIVNTAKPTRYTLLKVSTSPSRPTGNSRLPMTSK